MSAEARRYPDEIEIQPLDHPVDAAVQVPGSKSITNRALVLAALCSRIRKPRLFGCLRSEDTDVMIACLRQLGIEIEMPDSRELGIDPPEPIITVFRGDRPLIPAERAELFVANSGTTMRFLTAMVCLGHGRYRLDGIPRMRERPIDDLTSGLRQLGTTVRSEHGNGCPPVIVEAAGLEGGRVNIRGNVSSQFLSALLMVAPFARHDVIINVDGELVSEPYVDMTIKMMGHWSLQVDELDKGSFHIPGGQKPDHIRASSYDIESDASAASYFFAAAAIAGGRVTVLKIPEQSLQGDVRFVDILGDIGCRVERCSSGITIHGRRLHGIDVDMNDISDTVMTLAVVACFAEGPTTIRNVAHIRHKETDRISALATELRKIGAGVEEFPDGLRITPGPLHGAAIDTYNDHRMAMSFALIGLKVPGIVIRNPGCVAKTYPNFFEDLERLR